MLIASHLLILAGLGGAIPEGALVPHETRGGPQIRRVRVAAGTPLTWSEGGGRLRAGPGATLVTFADRWADGFVGLVGGRLDVEGAEVSVVLPHGTVTGRGAAEFSVTASPDGHAAVRVESGEVLYQGDGGGAGRTSGGVRDLRVGPDGVFRPSSAAVALPPALSVEAADALLARLRTWAVKRSFKLAAMEKRQVNLRSEPEGPTAERARRRRFELRARQAVVLAWVELVSESFQPLGLPIVSADDEIFVATRGGRPRETERD